MLRKYSNGVHYNMELYIKIKKERKKLGLKIQEPRYITDSILLKKKLKNKITGKIYFVDSIKLSYQIGYYYTILYHDENDSHGIIFWNNISCGDDTIINTLKKCEEKFEFID